MKATPIAMTPAATRAADGRAIPVGGPAGRSRQNSGGEVRIASAVRAGMKIVECGVGSG